MVKNQESKIPQFYDILDEELDKTNEIFNVVYNLAKVNGFINVETTKFELQERYLSATKVSSTGTIFGSVGNIQIAEELAKLGHNIDRKIIVVKDAVKEVGSYKAIVKLHKEVSVEIPFEVVAEEA